MPTRHPPTHQTTTTNRSVKHAVRPLPTQAPTTRPTAGQTCVHEPNRNVRDMVRPVPELTTTRLRLRRWCESDREAFAELNTDTEVMADLGGPLDRNASDRKLDHYAAAFEAVDYGRWCLEWLDATGSPRFLGYAGVMPVHEQHPLGGHDEIGWRLHRDVWGLGIASEATRAALDDVFSRIGLREVLSYTSADNTRSQAVTQRIGLERDESRDFSQYYEQLGTRRGHVWFAANPGTTRLTR